MRKNGDFYTLMSLAEDHRDEDRSRSAVYYDIRIVRACEALLHCANLYKMLGVEPNAHIQMTVGYGGLRGRTLRAASPNRGKPLTFPKNHHEDEVNIPAITFRLGAVQAEMVELVKKLCEPLFVIFDYAEFSDEIYREIVTEFISGKIR